MHTPFLNGYARGWVRYERDWAGGPVIWHNGSNTLWYALLMLLPARNMTLAFVTNDGALEVADTAFWELGRELTALRDRLDPPNRPPEAVGTLPAVRLSGSGATLEVDVSAALGDPDGDPLTYTAASSAPRVVTARVAGARVTLTAVSAGWSTIRVTAADPGGLSATQSFTVAVPTTTGTGRFTDDPLRPGATPVRAVHFTELRERIDVLGEAAGLGRFRWTDPVLRAGVTPMRFVHLVELRSALAAAVPGGGPARSRAGRTRRRRPGPRRFGRVHVMELRAGVVALE